MSSNLFSWITENTSLNELATGIELAHKHKVKTLLLLTCNDNNYPEKALNDLLNQCTISISGGIYPMISHKNALLKHGAIIIGFEEELKITHFPQLQNHADEEALELLVSDSLKQNNNLAEQSNVLMFYDGLMPNIEDFIDCLFDSLEHSITIAGGGAGNLDFIQRPCVFTNQGLQSNIVQLVNLPSKLSTEIAHGWEVFEGPFLASETQGQTVKSLNYQPAFDVYAKHIEKTGAYKFNANNFFDIAKHFPLGVEEINGNLIVRDPILTSNKHLQCVGKIPINSMVHLLKGDTNHLVTAATNAAKTLFSSINNSSDHTALVFDCISRVLYLEDDFSLELNAINNQCHFSNLFGVLPIGEIANNHSGSINLLNKSVVISTW